MKRADNFSKQKAINTRPLFLNKQSIDTNILSSYPPFLSVSPLSSTEDLRPLVKKCSAFVRTWIYYKKKQPGLTKSSPACA